MFERNVFCGPSCVFTNDLNPRVNYPKNKQYIKAIVRKGATIGANVTLICGIEVGEYAFIGAGSVASKPVLAYELVYGNSAIHKGWICKCGTLLNKKFECPQCKIAYGKNRDGLYLL